MNTYKRLACIIAGLLLVVFILAVLYLWGFGYLNPDNPLVVCIAMLLTFGVSAALLSEAGL